MKHNHTMLAMHRLFVESHMNIVGFSIENLRAYCAYFNVPTTKTKAGMIKNIKATIGGEPDAS